LARDGGVDSADGVGGGFGCLQMSASPCTLAAERHPAGAHPGSGDSGRHGVEARGRERGRACARGVLVASSLHARELNQWRTDVESRAGACLERRGRRRLGVEWWRWCTSGLGGSPGESAGCSGAGARAGLVRGGREDGWVLRCSTSASGQSVGEGEG
jgi:hypothetical protein